MTFTKTELDQIASASLDVFLATPGAVERMQAEAAVERPAHYVSGEIECIDAIEASMSAEEFRGYLKGNVQKYVWRYRQKGGAQDLDKADWYLRRLRDHLAQKPG